MKSLAVLVGAALLLAAASIARAGEPDVVLLDSGPVRGRVVDGVRQFLGIPYAAPPLGALRWKAPRPVESWTQPRDCAEFGPACPQPRRSPDGRYDEDCLTLNVWIPAQPAASRLPTMVWIHGGAFNFGSSSQPEYNGSQLARQGVTVVTLNYRLGPLGFFVHPQLEAESGPDGAGNYGLLDQIAALDWVRRNIAAFGGDPANVTVFGQSAGSRSVSLLLISPLSRGLFHKAIAQSGGPILGSEYLNPVFNGDRDNVARMGQELAARLGCNATADVLAALRAKTALELVDSAACSTSLFDEGLFFAPVFGGRVLPDNPLTAFTTGRYHDVPVIVGSTGNEGTLYLTGEKGLTLERYAAFIQARFGVRTADALRQFPAAEAADVPRAIDHFLTVAANAHPARVVARSVTQHGGKAWLYQFTRKPDTALGRRLGAHHGVDIAYVFGTMDRADGYADADFELSQQMMGYWVQFAATGDPNAAGLPVWPAFDPVAEMSLEFGDSVTLGQHLYREDCIFLDQVSRFRQR